MVSIVIPMYNAEATVIRALESILKQTYKNYEVLVIDDGSKDNSYKVVHNFIQSKKLINFKVLKQNNSGPSRARNRGIKEARGNYIAFLDSDDSWIEQKLEKQIKILKKNPEVGMIVGTLKTFKGPKLIELDIIKLLLRNYISTPAVILKKEMVDKVGMFDENMKYCEDAEFWFRILTAAKVVFFNEVLIKIGDGDKKFGNGLSSNFLGMYKGAKYNLKNLYKKNALSKNKLFNFLYYLFFRTFFYVKYIRRKLIFKIKFQNI